MEKNDAGMVVMVRVTHELDELGIVGPLRSLSFQWDDEPADTLE